MSKGNRYTQEFKVEALKQIMDGGYSVAEVSKRLGVCSKTLYHWRNQLTESPKRNKSSADQLKIAQLESELKRVKKERDILKKATRYFANKPE